MPKSTSLHSSAPWVELQATEQDWKRADSRLLDTMLASMHIIRAFEETVLELAGQGLVHGPAHSSIGQEGGAAGSIVGLTAHDQVNGSHRGHHQFIAKMLGYLQPDGIDPRAPVAPEVAAMLQRTLAEILGLSQGYCKGRGGSMHLQYLPAGALGTNAIVGGGVPLAAGSAWANAHSGSDAVAVTYFGDGAINIGSVLETMNLASAWKLPLCFFVENNGYAVSTTVDEATGEPRLAARGQAFNIPSWSVDGMDPLQSIWPCRRQSRTCGRARARPSSRRGSTVTSTRTDHSLAAPLATGPRKKKQPGANAIRSNCSRARCRTASALPHRKSRRCARKFRPAWRALSTP